MKTLGITGGIGSGKTTVCKLFEDLGARVIYADDEAKRIMHENPDVRVELMAAFGPESYDEQGRLNRAYLAQQVFGNAENIARINAIVHPRVGEALQQSIRQAEADGVDLLVYESALLFETGGDQLLDAIAVVDAPLETRMQRVMARDEVSKEKVEARMKHQRAAKAFRERADYLIENDGEKEALQTQVEAVYAELLGANGT